MFLLQRLLSRSLLVALMATSFGVHALSLGGLTVYSRKGQPLQADIEIVEAAVGEAQGAVDVGVATAEEYRNFDIQYNPVVQTLRFEAYRRPDNRVFFRLTSPQALEDGLVHLLMNARWASSSVRRQYIISFDEKGSPIIPSGVGGEPSESVMGEEVGMLPSVPLGAPVPLPSEFFTRDALESLPSKLRGEEALVEQSLGKPAEDLAVLSPEEASPAPTTSAPLVALTPSLPVDKPAHPSEYVNPSSSHYVGGKSSSVANMEKATARPQLSRRPLSAAAKAEEQKNASGGVRVHKGQTIGGIAQQHLPSGVSLDQMVVAIFQANQGIFIDSNVNLVKAGSMLVLPEKEQAQQTTVEEAKETLRVHAASFNKYRNRLSATASPSVGTTEQEAKGKIGSRVTEDASSGVGADRLALSNPQSSPASQHSTSGQSDAVKNEHKIAEEKQQNENSKRMQEMQSNARDLEKLSSETAVNGAAPTSSGGSNPALSQTTPSGPLLSNSALPDVNTQSGQAAGKWEKLFEDYKSVLWLGFVVLAFFLYLGWRARRLGRAADDSV